MRKQKHGECIGKGTKLYWVWHGMIQRIFYKNGKAYKNYGGRGISVCDEWLNPINFFSWAKSNGYKEGLTIDRINNDGNYCPENCRFTTRHINNLNKRYKENAGIYFHKDKKDYQIDITRNGIHYYGGRTKDYSKAILMRNELLTKIKENGKCGN
jgi:hypothetical protein